MCHLYMGDRSMGGGENDNKLTGLVVLHWGELQVKYGV